MREKRIERERERELNESLRTFSTQNLRSSVISLSSLSLSLWSTLEQSHQIYPSNEGIGKDLESGIESEVYPSISDKPDIGHKIGWIRRSMTDDG